MFGGSFQNPAPPILMPDFVQMEPLRFLKASAALARVIDETISGLPSSGDMLVAMMADSKGTGFGGPARIYASETNTQLWTDAKKFAALNVMARLFDSPAHPTMYESFFADNNATEASHTISHFDVYEPKITRGAGWVHDVNRRSIGGNCIVNSTDTSAFDYTPAKSVDTFDLMLYCEPGQGQLVIKVNEGSGFVDPTSMTMLTSAGSSGSIISGSNILDTSQTASTRKVRIKASSSGTRTFRMSRNGVGGLVHPMWIIPSDSQVPRVNFINCSEASADELDMGSTAHLYSAGNVIQYVGAHLVYLKTVTNSFGHAKTTFVAGMNQLVTSWQSQGADVIMVCDTPVGVQTEAVQDTFNAYLHDIAAANSCALIDLRRRAVSFASWSTTRKMMVDSLHDTGPGQAINGHAMYRPLLWL